MTQILALDLSLTATGWAHTDGASGVLVPPDRVGKGIDRVRWIRANVRAMPADLVVIEGYAFGANNKAHQLGELGGVIRVTFRDLGVPYADVQPAALKLFATGKGNAPKLDVFSAAIRQLNYTGTSTDEADALWLLAMARAHYWGVELTEKKRAAVAKVQWPTCAPLAPRTSEPIIIDHRYLGAISMISDT